MIQKFIAFNIIWYSPENSEKLEDWVAFSNVNVEKISDEKEFIKAAERSYLFNKIVIASGSFAEKTIPLMDHNTLNSNIIIIYCMNLDYHKKWSEKYESIIDICVHPAQIFESLLKIHKYYNIPLFSYKINYKKEFNFDYYDKIFNYDAKLNDEYYSLNMDDYEKFCLKTLHDYRLAYEGNQNYFIKFNYDSQVIFKSFYGDNPLIFLKAPLFYKYLALNFQKLTLLSLYFSKFPYIFGVLTYEEIENILKRKEEENYFVKEYKELFPHINSLTFKLDKEKASILEETEHLKFLQQFLIGYIKRITKFIYKLDNDDFSKYPVMIK